jgi:transketolase
MTNVLEPAFVPSVETDLLAIDTLHFLAADMVQAANSGEVDGCRGPRHLLHVLIEAVARVTDAERGRQPCDTTA